MDPGSPGVAHTLNGSNPLEEDDFDSDRDSSSSVSSMSSDEIESHFVERNDRRFHSAGSVGVGIYPLPVDNSEGQRMNRTHQLVKEVLGGRNYLGPVQQTLAEPAASGRRVRVLDVCTGNGQWVEEIADEFPHAKIYGIDIAPLATRYPADNVQFEVHDINIRTRWVQGRFDFVHIRQVCLCPINYRSFLQEVARVLRPGGLFLACEWMLGIFKQNSSDGQHPSDHATEFFHHLRGLAAQRHLFCDPSSISNMLAEGAYYENVVPERRLVHLDDSPRGLLAKQHLLDFANAVQHFFLDSGVPTSQVEDMLLNLRRDLDNRDGLCLVYFTIHARRKATV